MNLDLSWNLFILVIFAVIICYSFIIGLHRIFKTIIASYLAILAADGLGNLFQLYFLSSENFVKFLDLIKLSESDESLIVIKVTIFVSFIVILTIKGIYKIEYNSGLDGFPNVFFTGIFAFLSAGLIMSTLLVYISGVSFVQATPIDSNIVDIYNSSKFVRHMIDYKDVWFSMPVVGLLLTSIFFNKHLKEVE